MNNNVLAFTKMQSLGNDFVLIDGVRQHIRMSANFARRIADRHYGIGCDQIIIAEPGKQPNTFKMAVFNADGSEVGQCGNGVRCFARFLQDQGLSHESIIAVETITTNMDITMNPDQTVTASMGLPEFDPKRIPLSVDAERREYTILVEGREVEFAAVSIGNPHCVINVPDYRQANVEWLGPRIESHPVFPERVNVGFRQIVSRNEVNLRVFERGVGETLGCGSGACAAVACGIREGILGRQVTVNLPGGSITVDWASERNPVRLTGAVETVFRGQIDLPDDIRCTGSGT
ncbi:MAG: diaminopimelate epimerase [Gammaproteobacteria bacterium]|nr:diaminopimelate epimerase [Gammaproteobacteria bacterium]